ncbi:putative C6 transcription factor [Aspergillus homomorphus CBS 101889]|uniref:Zn(2)-C6 fungal-type domain-containing protein n=1 Tax=Aspergillus homomorphus (strain CBS 101889) TaxID=1450537 RepID=A0A395HLL8_ASPHC|nr:hypothetical protein BO97DRAFT_480352 [Aspergillus homomorphus CBS 101889]RAL08831.1 hypothetical protein BO97DRAFT_480352 [Aspergillus homomorphus CBS 101889]
MPPTTNTDSDQLDNGKDKGLACQSCRRKKTKCDREQPCAQCVRFDVICTYDDYRLKPGLRAGAVERLQRRVETLENMFIGQGMLWQKIWDAVNPSLHEGRSESTKPADKSLGRLCDEVKQSLLREVTEAAASRRSLGLDRSIDEIDEIENEPETRPEQSPAKRRRLDSQAMSKEQPLDPMLEVVSPASNGLPSRSVMLELVEFHFANVHPWIPILHVRRFREQLQIFEGWEKAIHILHAIVATCIRFTNHPDAGSIESRTQMAAASRQRVILKSMESFSVENLQALVIIAFDTIGSGRGPSAWSIVGSMTRTVEQLQLSVEDCRDDEAGNGGGEYLIRRMVFLKPTQHWWQAEERRRVFWTVFLMDRFCSVSTGWNLGLTTADVRRRLPCEGALWEREQEVRTPLFGIADKAGLVPSGANPQDPEPEQDAIGGFAYAIEATESLTLVINFFLRHALDLQDTQKTQLWLMKFKELDLRLVQWKLFLPSKWRSASVLNADGIMDPNLTLAHFTHNTAVILLHQSIAYPPTHWKSCSVRFPSVSSAETCLEAASEIVTVGSQFLEHSSILANPQFSFCLFIAGRMLFTHSRYVRIPLSDQLESIISSLLEISRRWAGSSTSNNENLASVFAKRLMNAKQQSHSATSPHTSLDIRQTVYSDNPDQSDSIPTGGSRRASRAQKDITENSLGGQPATGNQGSRDAILNGVSPSGSLYDALSLAYPPLPLSLQAQYAPLTEGHIIDPALLGTEPHDSSYDIESMSALHNSQFWDQIPQ